MDCARFQKAAWRLLDAAAEPSADETPDELRRHIESCGSCRSAWEEAVRARDVLRAAAREELTPPEAAKAAVLRRAESMLGSRSAVSERTSRALRARSSARRSWVRFRPLLYVSIPAAAAVLLAISYRVPSSSPRGRPPLAEDRPPPVPAEPSAAAGPAEAIRTPPTLPERGMTEVTGSPADAEASPAAPGSAEIAEAGATSPAELTATPSPPVALESSPADTSSHFAYLDAAEGRVEVMRRGGEGWVRASAGVALGVGDRLRTGDARARLVLGSGSIVCVNRLATLEPLAGSPGGIFLGSGEVYVETVHADRGFAVSTPHGRSRALGTKFDVASGALGTKVLVAEGEVEVSTGASAAIVPAGFETALLRADLAPGRVQRAASLERRLAWVTGVRAEPAAARLVVWDGDERHSAGLWVVPEATSNWARIQTEDAHDGRAALEFHGEGAGYIGLGCNWRSWSRQGGTDVSGFRDLVFWVKARGGLGPEQFRIGLSSKGMKYTRQVEVVRYVPDVMDGRWHRVAIPLGDLAEGSEFDPTSAWEIQFNTWSARPLVWSLLVDGIAFEGRP